MSTFTTVNTYTHSVTYVANKLLQCLKDIVRLSGLNPEKLTNDWTVLERGIANGSRRNTSRA
jgi:Bacterial HORMA domain 2